MLFRSKEIIIKKNKKRNKYLFLVLESKFDYKASASQNRSWFTVFPSIAPIQIRGMLKCSPHLIDFSTPPHNLLLTDLEFSGLRPGLSHKGINDMSRSV